MRFRPYRISTLALVPLLLLLWPLALWADQGEVVIYTSLDRVFSEPILDAFESETGIRVQAVYDVEASKTTGLVNRLIAERAHPRADVFWNSEVGRTLLLQDKGVLAPYRSPSAPDIPDGFKDPDGYWTGFAARARVLIVNTNLLQEPDWPRSIFDLTAPAWRGRVAIAYPLFGTTATHVAALYAVLGADQARHYLQGLVDNDAVVVDGNAYTRDLVARGELPVAFTDTDDANLAIAAGKPVAMILPDGDGIGTLLIPNTVALIAGAPHPANARRLIDYLLSPAVEQRLAFSESVQIPVRDGVPRPAHVPTPEQIRAMDLDYRAIADQIDPAMRDMRALFRR